MTATRPPAGVGIHVRSLSKTFRGFPAVSDLSFEVAPGRVTGFLGPNGSGKSTTLRMMLGLVTPTSGTATFGDQAYADLPHPGRLVGASLEASFHPGRTARAHLRTLAPLVLSGGAASTEQRISRVLEDVGLSTAADRRIGEFSLGMRQRLGLAGALLGDPSVVLLDEPINGLDPEGIVWMRGLLRGLADEGRTVLLSSHALGEVQHVVDDVVVIAGGRLVQASTLADLTALAQPRVWVTGPDLAAVEATLGQAGWSGNREHGGLLVPDATAAVVGHLLFAAGVEVHGLRDVGASLEETFLALVHRASQAPVQGDAA